MKNHYKIFTPFGRFLFLLVISVVWLQATSYSKTQQIYDDQNGDWSAQHVVLTNTTEAELMVRAGDIDNLGFGWPSDFDPFSGESTGSHSFPWTPDSTDASGTDRIMVVSSYNGSPPAGTDGYTSTTSRPENTPRPIVLNYDLNGISVKSAVLQIFVDDFQASLWGADYFVSINGVKIPEIAKTVNALVQSGPVGKLINVTIPQEYLYLLESDSLSILFDDTTTGAGDGYAIDFVKLLINIKAYSYTAKVYGYVLDTMTNAAVKNAVISASGESTTSDENGYFILDNLPAGIISFSVYKIGYDTTTALLELSAGDSIQHDFKIKQGNAIVSTTSGGNWNDTLTWIGHVVPTADDNVVIDGTVVVNTINSSGYLACNSIVINDSDSLLMTFSLDVKGDIENNGFVLRSDDVEDYNHPILSVYGDMLNAGIIKDIRIIFRGDADNELKMGANDTIISTQILKDDSSSYLIIGSDARFKYCDFCNGDYGVLGFDNQYYQIKIKENSNYVFDLLRSSTLRAVVFEGSDASLKGARLSGYFTYSTYIKNTKFSGYNSLSGSGVVLENVSVQDTLNMWGISMTTIGNFVNNGYVLGDEYEECYLVFNGDSLINNKDLLWTNILFKGITNDQVYIDYNYDVDKSGMIFLYANVAGATSYQWVKDGVNIEGATSSSLLTGKSGVYYCKTDAGNSRTMTVDLKEEASLVADFSADKTSGTAPLTVQFTDKSTGNVTSWSWDFGDGGTSTEQNPSHVYTAAGDYTVILTVSDGTNSSTETKSNYITVSASSGSELLKEHFDSETFPPSGWSVVSKDVAYTWQKGNPDGYSFTDIDPTNVYSAVCNWDANDQDEWLKTPAFDLPDGTINLEFYAGYNSYWVNNATLNVYISTDNGTTWDTIWNASMINTGDNWAWEKIGVDLSAYAGKSGVMLAWQYVGNDGDLMAIDNVEVTQGTTGVNDQEAISQMLLQNYPNPFSSQTHIVFKLEQKADVKLIIYNSLGQQIAVPVSGEMSAGNHQVLFDGSSLRPGIYYYRLMFDGKSTTKRMIIMK